MEYVEAPENWDRLPGQPSVFLAGGITDCPNWQREVAQQLIATNYAVLNPRRENFPIGDPNAAPWQIKWEFDHLRKADLIAFWFCKETIQPIALFELGAWSRGKQPAIVVGVEPGYVRELDVHIQMNLLGRLVVSSLNELVELIKSNELSLVRRLEMAAFGE
jgi:hypothetical protein